MNQKKILVCIDGSKYSKSACDYGIFISKLLDLPLFLLNVIEHSSNTKNIDLSGNIGLGAKDRLLEELIQEEAKNSKITITQSVKVLNELNNYVQEQGVTKVSTLQRRGTLDETLDEFSNEIKIAIIGFNGRDTENNITIGKNIEEIIRSLNIPILLVNSEFKPINSILMAYDGSKYAKKAIDIAIKDPIFPNVLRHIININEDKNSSIKLLDEAKEIFNKAGFDVEVGHLNGERVDEILKYQNKKKLDIIAMGAYSHNRLRSVIFGSFTRKMLLTAKTPLLLFR